MSKPLGTVWDLEPHTAKKHEILRRYFQAWLPILAQTNGRLLYLDGFAGPGEYSRGEDGSPLVVLKAARDHKHKITSELVCIFVENNRDRFEHLLGVLATINPPLPGNIKFHAEHGAFNDQLTQIFRSLEEQKKHLAPTLAFVDPFGFSQTPFGTIRHPPGRTTDSPQLGSCRVGDLLAANSTATRRPGDEIGLSLLFQRSFFR